MKKYGIRYSAGEELWHYESYPTFERACEAARGLDFECDVYDVVSTKTLAYWDGDRWAAIPFGHETALAWD